MKNIKFFALFFGFLFQASMILYSQPKTLKWYTDYSAATQQAVKEKKPVLLFFHGSDWCPPCIKMQKEVFASEDFISFAKSRLIFVDVDFPYKNKLSEEQLTHNKSLKKKFGLPEEVSQGYPQVVIIDPTGKVLYQEKGYTDEGPKKLKAKISSILEVK